MEKGVSFVKAKTSQPNRLLLGFKYLIYAENDRGRSKH